LPRRVTKGRGRETRAGGEVPRQAVLVAEGRRFYLHDRLSTTAEDCSDLQESLDYSAASPSTPVKPLPWITKGLADLGDEVRFAWPVYDIRLTIAQAGREVPSHHQK